MAGAASGQGRMGHPPIFPTRGARPRSTGGMGRGGTPGAPGEGVTRGGGRFFPQRAGPAGTSPRDRKADCPRATPAGGGYWVPGHLSMGSGGAERVGGTGQPDVRSMGGVALCPNQIGSQGLQSGAPPETGRGGMFNGKGGGGGGGTSPVVGSSGGAVFAFNWDKSPHVWMGLFQRLEVSPGTGGEKGDDVAFPRAGLFSPDWPPPRQGWPKPGAGDIVDWVRGAD